MSEQAKERPPIRVLIGKPGLCGHNRGVRVIVRALREAGMEVIYTGIRRTPEEIAAAAVSEDVDAVGVSSLSGAHLALFPMVAEQLQAAGCGDDVVLFCGGTIPIEDRPILEKAGFQGIFTPGTPVAEVVDFVRAHARIRGQFAGAEPSAGGA